MKYNAVSHDYLSACCTVFHADVSNIPAVYHLTDLKRKKTPCLCVSLHNGTWQLSEHLYETNSAYLNSPEALSS